jgi:Glu-tRNA(Gln) amidotransferase subunit E-like FAD-binding protein
MEIENILEARVGLLLSMKKNESHHTREKRIRAVLREFGISSGLAKRIAYHYPLNVVEKLIKETKKRQPANPANYLLSGLQRSRIKYKFNIYPKKHLRRKEDWRIFEKYNEKAD